MASLSSQSAVGRLLERFQSEPHSPHEVGVAFAALIYLRWADFQEAEREAIAAFDDVEYKPVLSASLHWRTWHLLSPPKLQDLFTNRLSQILSGLNNSRHNSLATHLNRIALAVNSLGRLSPGSIDVMVHWLADQPFETQRDRRILLDVFDSILDKGFGSSAGEYRTPSVVARIFVEIAGLSAGNRVYDPCFGSAGLLTAACDHVMQKEKDQFARNNIPPLTIFGVEKNPNVYIIGLTRLALAGIDDPQLELGSSLERLPPTNLQRDGFDVVLVNPPWGIRADLAGMDHFPVRTSDSSGLFIQHALSQLRPQGRALVVVPESILFRGGQEQRLRRMLLEQHTVEAVVSLPQNAFKPYTAVKASILVLRREGPAERVRMIDAEPYFEKGKGKQPATIINMFVEELGQMLRAPEPSKNCWDVDVQNLSKSGWDLSARRREESGLAVVINSLRSKTSVLTVKECCKVITAKAIKTTDVIPVSVNDRLSAKSIKALDQIEKVSRKDLIPYVMIRDIQRGQVSKVYSSLAPNAVVPAESKLRAGDILLSKSGTIGKVGIVRNGAVGAVASSGLYVLRPDHNRLDPHFLLAYLESSECRAWFTSHARGATIQHLSKQVLNDLPIPLPPLQVQQRVVDHYRDQGLDALVYLTQLLTSVEKDINIEWLESIAKLFPSNLDSIKDPLGLGLLDDIATAVRPIRNETAHYSHLSPSALAGWVLHFNEGLSGLRGAKNIPRGPSLLNLLQESSRKMNEAMQMLKGHSPEEFRALNLTKLVVDWLRSACALLLSDVKIVFSTDSGRLQAGEMVDVELQVHNQGALPLRDVNITTSPDLGQGQFGYIAENSKVIVNLAGTGPKMVGIFTLLVNWSGITLDGQKVNGSRELAFNVSEATSVSAAQAIDPGGSPYICGDPVSPERNEVFLGRDELLEQIRRQITLSGNVVLLEGNRRSGKSSILRHLEGLNTVPGWLGVYSSLQGTEGSREGVGVPTVEVFRGMAISIATSLQRLGTDTPLPDGSFLPPGKRLGITDACIAGIKETAPFAYFHEYIGLVLEKLAQKDLGLLLMLDEFDKLQEGIDRGVTSPQVPENIRFLVQTYPRFSAILTGSRRLKRMREEYWSALFGLGTRFGVTSLPLDSARNLVTEPVKGRLTYSREAVERAITLTARQPYLLQCLCNRIFDMASQLKTRSVTLDLVERAGDTLVEDNEHFASLWDYAASDRRRFILALCQKEVTGLDPFRLGVIQERLMDHGIEVDDDNLIADLEFLLELELIDRVGESYSLSIPLMGMWIERQQDFAAILIKARSETEDLHE